MVDVGQQYEKVSADLKQVGDDLKRYAEQSQREIKNHAAMTAETKAKVDELLVQQGELQARLKQAEQILAEAGRGGGGSECPKSLGQQVADSEEYLAVRGQSRAKFTVPVKMAVTELGSSAGDLIEPQRVPGVVALPERRLTVRDLLRWGTTGSNSVEFVRETGFTNNADVVSENPNTNKPESDLTFEADQAAVATIAHWVHASRQVLSDAGMLQAYIDGRLRYGLKLKEELQLLKGSGVGLNINGLVTQATAYANPGVTVQAETFIDRLRLALLQAELAEYPADGIVLHPTDWAAIELTKTSDNAYLFSRPDGAIAARLWNRPVVPTQSMDLGDYLVGAFGLGAMGWDREQASVTVSTEDRDNFVKNMVTILCEERVALTVFRPEAFVTGDFDGLPTT